MISYLILVLISFGNPPGVPHFEKKARGSVVSGLGIVISDRLIVRFYIVQIALERDPLQKTDNLCIYF